MAAQLEDHVPDLGQDQCLHRETHGVAGPREEEDRAASDDPGGRGEEIVKEVDACPACARTTTMI